jgi:hypothetical protein
MVISLDITYATRRGGRQAMSRKKAALHRTAPDPAAPGRRGARVSWTPELVVNRIRSLHAAGRDISVIGLQRAGESSLLGTAHRHFGSYAAAVGAAGIDYASVRKTRGWTRDALLDELRARHRAGGPPGRVRSAEFWRGLGNGTRRLFGTRGQALAAAGIEAPVKPSEESRRRAVLERLRALHAAGHDISSKRLVSTKGLTGLWSAAIYYYGSYGAAVEAAGIDYASVRKDRRWTRQEVVDGLRARHLAGELWGRRRADLPLHRLFDAGMRLFGSRAKALAAAGIERRPKPSEQSRRRAVLERLRALHAAGQDISISGLRFKAGLAGLWARAVTLYGTYAAAVEAAGIDYTSVARQRRWTPEAVLDALRARDRERRSPAPNRPPPSLSAGLHSAATRLFGSYWAACAAAGVDPKARRASTRRATHRRTQRGSGEVVAELRRRHNAGLPLTIDPKDPESRALYAVARYHFGSYADALRAAGIDPQKAYKYRVHSLRH